MEVECEYEANGAPWIDSNSEVVITEAHRLKGMCRVCSSSRKKLISIFGELGTKRNIAYLIHTYLPILVTQDDLLPISICDRCLSTLSASQALVETCIQANDRMQNVLNKSLFKRSKEEVASTSSTSIKSVLEDDNFADSNRLDCSSLKLKSNKKEVGFESTPVVLPIVDNSQNSQATLMPALKVPVTEEPRNPTSANQGKLYRCLYCDRTDSDAYLLLLHQVEAHPTNLLKCNKCEFICSSDQKAKYDDHLQFHKDKACSEIPICSGNRNNTGNKISNLECEGDAFIESSSPEKTVGEMGMSDGDERCPILSGLDFERDDKINRYGSTAVDNNSLTTTHNLEHPAAISGLEEFTSVGDENSVQLAEQWLSETEASASAHSTADSNSVTRKKEVHWRCGYCGIRAKSKQDLVNHCAQSHKELLRSSLVQPDLLHSGALDCSHCKKTFSSEVFLKDHVCRKIGILPKPSNNTISCLSCPSVFYDSAEFSKHLKTHTSPFQCKICKMQFRMEHHLNRHIKKHEEKPKVKCPHCPRVFNLRSRLNIHIRTHTGETPYMCVKCGKRFSTDSGFRLHMSAHEGKRPYVCFICGRRFNRPSNLRRHESICGSDTRVKCRICGEGFPSRESLLCHRVMHTKEEKEAAFLGTEREIMGEDRFSCKVCDMKFDRVLDLSQHRQESHTMAELEEAKKAGRVDGGSYVCPECKKEVYSKKNYEAHMLRHTGQALHHCTVCSNVYSTKFALDYHMYTHTGERPFKCDTCSQGFKSNLSLRVHRMKHTGEKPFKCRQCKQGFFTGHSLRLHLVSHSEIRQFSCEFCPATFKRKRTLVAHVRVHTGEKPFACKHCEKRFTQRGTCTQHEKTHTNLKLSRKRAKRKEKTRTVAAFGHSPKIHCQHVAIIEDWNGEVDTPDPLNTTIGVLVSQKDGPALVLTGGCTNTQETGNEQIQDALTIPHFLAEEESNNSVQHMVLIQQNSTENDSEERMVLDEHMVVVNQDCIETTHAVIIGENGAFISEDPASSTVFVETSSSKPQNNFATAKHE